MRIGTIATLLFLLIFTVAPVDLHAATCKGEHPCKACKNCKACKHCSKDGKTCGICRPR